ncbi:hypothetical protein RQP46_003154 [Phenoliferia psychrophenolica]
MSLSERLSVVSNSTAAIVQILCCCEMSDQNPLAASPFVYLPFYVAGQALAQDWRIRTGKNVLSNAASNGNPNPDLGTGASSSTSLLASVAHQNFDLCTSALTQQSHYWMGIEWVIAILEKKGTIKTATVSRRELDVFKRLAQRISGNARTPDFDADYLASLFSTIQENGLDSTDYTLSQDDYAHLYTFAAGWPDSLEIEPTQ